MAVTGRGTQDDPYIVHDYYELRDTFPKQAKDEQGADMGSGSPCYIELVSDINCNDYGVDFVWEGLYTPSGYYEEASHTYLDLKGHTIKNFSIAASAYFVRKNRGGVTIKNGKILNVFGAGAAYFSSNIDRLENLCISMNMTGMTSGNNILSATNVYRCSIYCICKSQTITFLQVPNIQLCDVFMDIKPNQYFVGTGANTNTQTSCRFRGTVKGMHMNVLGSWAYSSGVAKDCVFNFEFINESQGVSPSPVSYVSGSTGNVENYELTGRKSHTSSTAVLYVDSDQMKNADYLSEHGFVVYDVTDLAGGD